MAPPLMTESDLAPPLMTENDLAPPLMTESDLAMAGHPSSFLLGCSMTLTLFIEKGEAIYSGAETILDIEDLKALGKKHQ